MQEGVQECAGGEAGSEGGTSGSPVWAWLAPWSCALGSPRGRASAEGTGKVCLGALGRIS